MDIDKLSFYILDENYNSQGCGETWDEFSDSISIFPQYKYLIVPGEFGVPNRMIWQGKDDSQFDKI